MTYLCNCTYSRSSAHKWDMFPVKKRTLQKSSTIRKAKLVIIHESPLPSFQDGRKKNRKTRKKEKKIYAKDIDAPRGGSLGQLKFKIDLLDFTSCLSKRPFPCHVITAYDPGWDFRFSFLGLWTRYAGESRSRTHASSPRDRARKRPLETRRFRAIRSSPRIHRIILKYPGLSLDCEGERKRERGKRTRRVLMHRNVSRLAISRGRRFISSVPTRGRWSLYAGYGVYPRDSTEKKSPRFFNVSFIAKVRSTKENLYDDILWRYMCVSRTQKILVAATRNFGLMLRINVVSANGNLRVNININFTENCGININILFIFILQNINIYGAVASHLRALLALRFKGEKLVKSQDEGNSERERESFSCQMRTTHHRCSRDFRRLV